MFRDLKEYHEIAKIYTEKVSKPENLEEMTGGLGVQSAQKMQKDIKSGELKQKPVMKKDTGKTFIEKGGIAGAINRVFKRKSREEVGLKPKPIQGRVSRSSQNMSGKPKPMPTTAEIRAKDKAAGGDGMSNIPSKEGNAVIGGKKLNPDFGKKVEIKKEPEISKFTKQGKTRTKAQMMAAKRIAAGKSISDVKSENEASMRAKAAERFAAFKAKRAAGKMNEDVTPYDIVLEYLLSSKQASTIEEANYVMSEMDAETIQSIVSD